jgi:hypothetical protein
MELNIAATNPQEKANSQTDLKPRVRTPNRASPSARGHSVNLPMTTGVEGPLDTGGLLNRARGSRWWDGQDTVQRLGITT